ncbi:MAG: hypothetical protein WA880_14150 [Ornithinimicrobium sp.]
MAVTTMVCDAGDTPIKIVGVTAVNPINARLDEFFVVDWQSGEGFLTTVGRGEEYRAGQTDGSVSPDCDWEGPSTNVGWVIKTLDRREIGSVDGVYVKWEPEGAGAGGDLYLPMAGVLCPVERFDEQSCSDFRPVPPAEAP